MEIKKCHPQIETQIPRTSPASWIAQGLRLRLTVERWVAPTAPSPGFDENRRRCVYRSHQPNSASIGATRFNWCHPPIEPATQVLRFGFRRLPGLTNLRKARGFISVLSWRDPLIEAKVP